MIKELRESTGAGVLACREALEESDGNLEKAVAFLHERGLVAAAKKADRETHDGVLDLYNHGDGRVGVIVEVNCETDFVARTEEFKHFAHEMALQIAANSPRWIRAEDIPQEVIEEERQNTRAWALESGKPENVIDRIVEGQLEKFFNDSCLLRQIYIRDDSKTVDELLKEMIVATGENITIRRFVRWTVGEELE
ncbi:MAG TPA: elongation factor Ts [Anaerolineae bacterium]|nr:elongation factor Ts [Anaerolineae bacterium]